MSQDKLSQLAIYVQHKIGMSLWTLLSRVLLIVVLFIGLFAMIRWFQGQTHKDYVKLYKDLHEENQQLLESNNSIRLSLDSLQLQRQQMLNEREVVIDLLSQRPQQISVIVRNYEALYNHIDMLPLDSIAQFLSTYRFDDTSPLPRSRGYVQP